MPRSGGPRTRFLAPQYDAQEGQWCVVIYFPISTGNYQRNRRWYRTWEDAWRFIMHAASDLRGEVTA